MESLKLLTDRGYVENTFLCGQRVRQDVGAIDHERDDEHEPATL
jgi:hypothetical protein